MTPLVPHVLDRIESAAKLILGILPSLPTHGSVWKPNPIQSSIAVEETALNLFKILTSQHDNELLPLSCSSIAAARNQ